MSSANIAHARNGNIINQIDEKISEVLGNFEETEGFLFNFMNIFPHPSSFT